MASPRKKTKSSDAIERRREVSAGGIVWRRNRPAGAIQIVMVKPAGKQAWTLPKGKAAGRETPVEAAARETREETGLEVTPGAQVGQISYVFSWHDKPSGPLVRIFKKVRYFLMEPRGGALDLHDDEIDEAKWVDLDEAVRLATYRSDREIIEKARAMLAEMAAN
jgi:8-oxo-dGTP pyrophosphatase MutT (NUDIX family)